MLLLTLRGTPTLYQGDEIGIGQVTIPPDRIRDPQDLRQPGMGLGRDRSRTPMPWDGSPHAGFSTVEPWLPLNDDWSTRNVAAQSRDERSLLTLYRRLLQLRRDHPALAVGDFALVASDADVLSYERRHDGRRLLIALNLADQPRRLTLPEDADSVRLLLSTLDPRPIDATLFGNEAMILELVAA
jgi:oligo-1,6-glucosidase/alpha-glucosidase